MRTRDLDEAIAAVSSVYCPHTIEVKGPRRRVDAVLEVACPTTQPIVELSYSTAVEIDAGDFPRLYLMMHCARGAASTKQEKRRAEWRRGQTLPFSAGCETRLHFDSDFVQRGLRLDADKLEALCGQWLGRPLEGPLKLDLKPFSADLEGIWQRTLAYLWSLEDVPAALAAPARAVLDEFLLTLLLHHHPHTYSAALAKPVSVPVPGIVRRAERYMADNARQAITVSDVAAELGVSLRSLQAGFRQWRATTPNAFLRQVRLQLARQDLLGADESLTVTAVALRYGFSHFGRFSAYYHAAFGEAPSTTLREHRRRR